MIELRKITCTIFILLVSAVSMHAQDYQNGIKLKAGRYFGVSYKYLNELEKGFEGIFQVANDGANLSGLRVFHTPAFPAKSSRWFFAYGYGAHISYYNHLSQKNPFKPFSPSIVYNGHFFSAGMDGYVSLEYRVLKHPFVLSADYLPNFEFFGPAFFRVNLDNITFNIAYVF